ncbi:NAD(P)/FAD-dependent oxidoreductase [Pararhodobacter sp. SW119]|uniref:FAD-dependent oxidoreductase n=1 Tax=Pararhodobacter sp. SW119 TaxID=2780075 RepID=UPI001ADF23BC|nr:NAD(P)/FAD-dependent oxidoreductase [Pararhodobacter sp. SW119]
MRTDYDMVIVGARCAGSAAALTLARGGARVLVVERDAPGTDTLSTHALMRGALMLLANWGLLDQLIAAGIPPIRTTIFDYGSKRAEVAIKPGHGVDALLSPRRWLLDRTLAAAANEAGAEIRYRTALRGLLTRSNGAVRGVVLTGPEGATTQVRAGLVIGADGRRSSVARMVGAPVERVGRHAASVIYAYVAGMTDHGTRWHYRPGIAAGAIPTNGGAHCVFVSAAPERYQTELRGDLSASLKRILAEVHPDLAAEVASGRMLDRPRAFAGEPGYFRRAHGQGWALAGDAGYFKDPITAHGITDALRDGWLLGEAALNGTAQALADYQALRDEISLPLFRATDAIAALPRDMDRLQALHFELSAAMKAEQEWLADRLAPAHLAA